MQEYFTPPLVAHDPAANIPDLLRARVAETPDAPLFALPQGSDGWTRMTAREFHDRVIALAKGFVAAGLEPGAMVGLLAKTRFEWTLIDFAAWFAGLIIVPVYETSSPSQVRYNLTDSGAVALIVETEEHAGRFEQVRGDLPAVNQVWTIDAGDLDALVAGGRGVPDAEIDRRSHLARGDDIATLIYTSGSTGRPKGCVLTHSNFVDLTRNAAAGLGEVVSPGSSTVLFITLAHIFARFISVLAVTAGVLVGHQADTKQLLPALASFQPTFLLAVPRVFEKVYNASEQKAEAAGKGRIFRAAAACAIAHSQALDRGKVPLSLRLRFALFERLVLSKIKAAMGGRVRYAVSGSAPLGAHLGHFFRSLDLRVLEGYGLTETTAPATVNLPDRFLIGTVGPALPGVGIRIAADGEVQVRGSGVFAGYWRNEEATRAVFDGEWFRTGDLGSVDESGYLRITGRLKDIIVTAGGKNVAPAALEDPIRANPIVGQIVVAGDQRPFITALVTLDPEMLPAWLANRGEPSDLTLAQAAEHPAVRAEIQAAVDAANETVSRAESIRKFTILPLELTEASGHLTPKLSIKRADVLADFRADIDAMYSSTPTTAGQSLQY